MKESLLEQDLVAVVYHLSMSHNLDLPYAKQSITKADIDAVAQSLKGDFITRGPKVREFEEAIAGYVQAKHAVAFNSGTAALQAACFAAEVGPLDRLITTPISYVATVGCGWARGALPIFIDIDRETVNMSLELAWETINAPSSRGRAIVIPVHFAGIPLDMAALDLGIQNPDTIIIEDAAHALGSRYPDKQMVGSCAYSEMTCFSFHPAKNLTTGEGGLVTTNSSEYAYRLRLFRDNGVVRDVSHLMHPDNEAPWYYEVQDVTANAHLTDFQAALGLSQLERLDEMNQRRRILIKEYRKRLKDVETLFFFPYQRDHQIAYHICAVQIDFQHFGIERKDVMEQLRQEGIGTQVHYIPLYYHPCFNFPAQELAKALPQTEAYYAQALTLPLFVDMTLEDVRRVAKTLKKILKKGA